MTVIPGVLLGRTGRVHIECRSPWAMELSGIPFDNGGSPDFLANQPDVEPPFSPITQAQDSESVGSPDVGLLVSPLVDVGTDTATVSVDQFLLCPPSKASSCRICCRNRLLFHLRTSTIVARPQYLSAGWLGRVRS